MNHCHLALLVVLCGCPPASVLPSGCGKDTDCKGTRVCIQHQCTDPPPRNADPAPVPTPPTASTPDPASSPDSDGGASPDGATVVTLPPAGPSPMFHGDPQHTGRSRFRAPTSAPREVMHVATGGAVLSSPAIAEGNLLVFGSHDKSIYAASTDGTIKWRKPTADLVWCSAALAAGVAYIGSDDDRLYALDLQTGDQRWQFTAGPCRVQVGSGPESSRCDVDGVTLALDGTIYFVADGLYALRPDGTLKWKLTPGRTHCAAAPALAPDGETIYFGCHDDTFYAVDTLGQKRWDFRAGDDIDSPPSVAPDGTIYFGADDKKLYALAPSGSLRWALHAGGAVRSSPAQAPDGTIYVGAFDGVLYAVRPNGNVAWTLRTADRILASPTVDAAGTVLVGSQDDRLYAVGADGKLAWSVLLDGDVDGTPALGPDGTIYVGADDRALHALK
jgi:outer membrane protein assembly factor BamB